MELQSINIFKDLDVKNTSYSKYTRLDIVRHYPAHVMEILPGWWDPKIKKVASRITNFDTQHFITIFFAISEPPKGLHGLHCSWVFSILVIPFCRGKPERRPENKTHALKSLDQPPEPTEPRLTFLVHFEQEATLHSCVCILFPGSDSRESVENTAFSIWILFQ